MNPVLLLVACGLSGLALLFLLFGSGITATLMAVSALAILVFGDPEDPRVVKLQAAAPIPPPLGRTPG